MVVGLCSCSSDNFQSSNEQTHRWGGTNRKPMLEVSNSKYPLASTMNQTHLHRLTSICPWWCCTQSRTYDGLQWVELPKGYDNYLQQWVLKGERRFPTTNTVQPLQLLTFEYDDRSSELWIYKNLFIFRKPLSIRIEKYSISIQYLRKYRFTIVSLSWSTLWNLLNCCRNQAQFYTKWIVGGSMIIL